MKEKALEKTIEKTKTVIDSFPRESTLNCLIETFTREIYYETQNKHVKKHGVVDSPLALDYMYRSGKHFDKIYNKAKFRAKMVYPEIKTQLEEYKELITI